jgi:hypothetical protein
MKRLLLAIGLVLAFSVSANALIITYDDKTDFLADTGASPTAPLEETNTAGILTFRDIFPSSLFTAEWTPLISGREIVIGSEENIGI